MPTRTFQYRLYPTSSQKIALQQILDISRHVYNMALEERKLAWEIEKQHKSKADSERLAKFYRSTFPQAKMVHSHVLQVAVADLDKAFSSFFRRVKQGQKAGYPRFKSASRWQSFGFKQYGNGFKLSGRRLKIFGVGRIAVRWHRPYQGEIKTCRLIRKAGTWYVSLDCEVNPREPLPATGNEIGIDLGINALITTSEGEKVDNPHWFRVAQANLRIKQRRLSRSQKVSNQRKKKLLAVQREYEHIECQRKDFIDKLVFYLIQNYDLIAIEDLKIKNMIRNHHLSKSILDAGWAYFRQRLIDKAAEAGRVVVLVSPTYTSKTCSSCGGLFENLKLSDRWVECACGLSLDRDHNAALNILKRAGRVRAP